MESGINQEELNNLIAQEIRDKGLNEVLKLETIKERVIQKIEELQQTQTVNELENPAVAKGPIKFPAKEDEEQQSSAETSIETEPQTKNYKEAGDAPLDVSIKPKVATQNIPDFLKNIEPGKVIIFNYNELSEGGENLTNKPFRTYDNPEEKKSISQMWSEEGKTKAEVYQAKFEKIGDLVYDYKNGTTNFEEINIQPETDENGIYKENPYKVEPNPIIEKDIENYITQNVDMDKKVNDVISNIVKDYFLTNSEQAIAAPPSEEVPIATPISPEQDVVKQNVAEGLKLEDLVGLRTKYTKIDTPKEVVEAFINGKSETAKLVSENNEVKKFILNEKEYFLPANPISTRKCYIKK